MARLRQVIKMEEGRLPGECEFFAHGNVQHAYGRWKGIHDVRHYLYLISEDVESKNSVPVAYGDSMKCDIQ